MERGISQYRYRRISRLPLKENSMSQGSILLIDDEEKLRKLLMRILELEGYRVVEAGDGKTGLRVLQREEIQIVISDVRLPDINGIDLVEKIKTAFPGVEIIMLTAYGTIQDGVKAIRSGAFDYITKGDDNDKLIPLVSRVMEKIRLQGRVQQLEKKIKGKYSLDNISGNTPQIREAILLARKVAPTDTTVLLLGETGTGKEVFAQAIHYDSSRKSRPFVAVNCAALEKDILESELFGYKAGAFTGAAKDKKGLFEEAHEGTIFLDEIGEMDTDLQAKLLRVLETGAFIKVGDTRQTEVNVRVIAATNKNLPEESDKGNFRPDLYYRLSVFQIQLPPLRERVKDIEPLAKDFLRLSALRMNKKPPEMTAAFIEKLKMHSWKGNIRELKNIMERVAILCDGAELTPELLPFEFNYPDPSNNAPLSQYDLAGVEKMHIQRVLQYTKGNKTEAALLLNIGLTTLYRKLEEYGMGK